MMRKIKYNYTEHACFIMWFYKLCTVILTICYMIYYKEDYIRKRV